MTRQQATRIVVELLGAFWLVVALFAVRACDEAPAAQPQPADAAAECAK